MTGGSAKTVDQDKQRACTLPDADPALLAGLVAMGQVIETVMS